MTDKFRIALLSVSSTNPEDWDDLDSLIYEADIPFDPQWTFQRYSGYVDLDDGTRKGTGLSKATWDFSVISETNRDVFRDYCQEADLSVPIYVETPTNEIDPSGNIEWFIGTGNMKWAVETEDKDAGATLNFHVEFDLLEEV